LCESDREDPVAPLGLLGVNAPRPMGESRIAAFFSQAEVKWWHYRRMRTAYSLLHCSRWRSVLYCQVVGV